MTESAPERDFKAEYVARVLRSPLLPQKNNARGVSSYWDAEDVFAIGEDPGVCYGSIREKEAPELEAMGKIIKLEDYMQHRTNWTFVVKAAAIVAGATLSGLVAYKTIEHITQKDKQS